MTLNTGNIVRLGRVIYIVKETSIDISKKIVTELEQVSVAKNKNFFESIAAQQQSKTQSKADEASALYHNRESKMT